MDRTQIETLLNEVREGRTAVNDALDRLRDLPFEDIGFAKVDHHRALRTGMPEVIFAAGKTPDQVAHIFARMANWREEFAPDFVAARKGIGLDCFYIKS